ARHMVTHWGMSDELGPIGYGENQQEIFLGHSVTQSKNVSEATAQTIDREIKRIVEEGYSLARTVLADNRHHLDRIAQALLEHETLTGEEIGAIMRGEPLATVRRDEHTASTPSSGKRSSVPTTSRPSGGEPPAGIEPSPQPGA
ncbi:MAG: cell division protein FtsH, partial [Geminicoccaceae bacterium]